MKDGSTAIDVHTRPTVSPHPQSLLMSVQADRFCSMRGMWEEPKQGEVEERCAGRAGTEILGEVGAPNALVRPPATQSNNQQSLVNVKMTDLTHGEETTARLGAGIISE